MLVYKLLHAGETSVSLPYEPLQDMYDLHHLYITDNSLDHIPLPLPESLQALHLQVGL